MLPHAIASTGRAAGAAACRAARAVPSPPRAITKSQDATSTGSAIVRACPGIRIWPIATPRLDAHARVAASAESRSRRG